jgi:NAD(P)-dependent dehydrogenase (short-subunit alcohol dehydrogenase family)
VDVAGRGAIVTGGAVRVGEAVARQLAASGANMFIHYNRSQGPARALQEEIRAAGGVAEIGSSDLADPSQALALMQLASDAVGPISILVNSASGFPRDRLESLTPASWLEGHDLTLGSPLFLTQALSSSLPKGEEGAIVNVTDVKTTRPDSAHFAYVLAKGGVDTLTRASALALAPAIRVNAVALGNILPPTGAADVGARSLALDVPLQRIGGAEAVAEAVLFLIKNDFITGEIVRLDGGAHLL